MCNKLSQFEYSMLANPTYLLQRFSSFYHRGEFVEKIHVAFRVRSGFRMMLHAKYGGNRPAANCCVTLHRS